MLSASLPRSFVILLIAAHTIHAAATSLSLFQIDAHSPNIAATTCKGSFWCPKYDFASNRINVYLQDWIKYTMSDSDIYSPGAQIACATVTILLPPLGTNAYCAYTKGITTAGINGSVIKQKMEQLRVHGCFACGDTAIADSGDASQKGVFVIDYIPKHNVKCGRPGEVVCPPTVPGADRVGNDEGARTAFTTFTATLDDGAITLQEGNVPRS